MVEMDFQLSSLSSASITDRNPSLFVDVLPNQLNSAMPAALKSVLVIVSESSSKAVTSVSRNGLDAP